MIFKLKRVEKNTELSLNLF